MVSHPGVGTLGGRFVTHPWVGHKAHRLFNLVGPLDPGCAIRIFAEAIYPDGACYSGQPCSQPLMGMGHADSNDDGAPRSNYFR